MSSIGKLMKQAGRIQRQMEQAQADGAPLLHQNRKDNILTQGYVKRGNIEKGFKNSKYILQLYYIQG